MAEEIRTNQKAPKLAAYFKKENINAFSQQEQLDKENTVLFSSSIKVDGQVLPFSIITDQTIYTIIRVQIGTGLVKENNAAELMNHLNDLNKGYKVFKYMAADDGSVYLDACIPSTNDSFDPEVVRLVLDVIVDHISTEYKNIMKLAWK